MKKAEPMNGVFWEIDGKLLACPFEENEYPEGVAKLRSLLLQFVFCIIMVGRNES